MRSYYRIKQKQHLPMVIMILELSISSEVFCYCFYFISQPNALIRTEQYNPLLPKKSVITFIARLFVSSGINSLHINNPSFLFIFFSMTFILYLFTSARYFLFFYYHFLYIIFSYIKRICINPILTWDNPILLLGLRSGTMS